MNKQIKLIKISKLNNWLRGTEIIYKVKVNNKSQPIKMLKKIRKIIKKNLSTKNNKMFSSMTNIRSLHKLKNRDKITIKSMRNNLKKKAKFNKRSLNTVNKI
jgi:phage antirepressor YoqD-like protein